MHGKGASFPATWLLRARLPSMFIGRGSNRFTEILAGLRRRGPFSMEIYSLILIKHFGSLGSHSSPRISPTLFEPCFVISRISSSHVKLKSIIPNLAILSVFSKFHHFIILYICWNEEFIVRDNDVFFKKILLYLLYKIFNKNPSNSLVYCKLSFHPSNWKRLAWHIFHFHPLKRYPYLEKIDLEKKKKF